jgi:energy-coupling factor transport system substrate-specific component
VVRTATPVAVTGAANKWRWRTVDIVVAAVIAVAGGVVFWAWSSLWNAVSGAFSGFPPGQAFMYGVWLAPGVIGGLVVRKPGAALFTELVASIIEALLGSSWGLSVIFYGAVQGLAPEIIFAVFAYRVWRLPVAAAAAALAGVGAACLDLIYYYSGWQVSWMLTYVVVVAASALVIAGIAGWALVRALAATGALQPFASGRAARLS